MDRFSKLAIIPAIACFALSTAAYAAEQSNITISTPNASLITSSETKMENSVPETMTEQENNEISLHSFNPHGKNAISANYLDNYYAYSGKAGDRIFIRVYLKNRLPSHYRSRCISDPKRFANYGISYGITYSSNYNCNTTLSYTLPSTGDYTFNFKYSDENIQLSGYFKVDIVSF